MGVSSEFGKHVRHARIAAASFAVCLPASQFYASITFGLLALLSWLFACIFALRHAAGPYDVGFASFGASSIVISTLNPGEAILPFTLGLAVAALAWAFTLGSRAAVTGKN